MDPRCNIASIAAGLLWIIDQVGTAPYPSRFLYCLKQMLGKLTKQYLCKVLILRCATANTAITISACVSRHFAELPGMNKSGRVIRYLLGSLSPTKQAAHSQGQHCARDCQRESELPTRNGNAQKSAQNNNCFHKLRKIDLPQARCPFHSVKELLLKCGLEIAQH